MRETIEGLPDFMEWDEGAQPYLDYTGPFYIGFDPVSEVYMSAFLPVDHHVNGGGMLHGGILMTFADYTLFVISRGILGGASVVTVSCQVDFLRAATPDGILFGRGEVVRDTKSLIFVRGKIYKDEIALANFSGIAKRVGVS